MWLCPCIYVCIRVGVCMSASMCVSASGMSRNVTPVGKEYVPVRLFFLCTYMSFAISLILSECAVADHRCSCAPYWHRRQEEAPPLPGDHFERLSSRPSILTYKEGIYNPTMSQCSCSPKHHNNQLDNKHSSSSLSRHLSSPLSACLSPASFITLCCPVCHSVALSV